MKEHSHETPLQLGRRQLLTGVGAAAVVGSAGAVGLPRSALARDRRRDAPTFSPLPAPSPIPGGVEAGPLGFIHWFLPGPEGSTTPFAQLPGGGLDVEPSTLTNFQGFTAFAILAGQAEDSNGTIYNVEFDVRLMEGEYVAEDGSRHQGAFGFF
jgi:hypothetical protein